LRSFYRDVSHNYLLANRIIFGGWTIYGFVKRDKYKILSDVASGVARVPCALGQEIFLRPLPTKITEFEVKNSRKNLKDAKFVLF